MTNQISITALTNDASHNSANRDDTLYANTMKSIKDLIGYDY